MARIRIIDEWLRSPVSPPSRHRAVMVVAESWSEQRVLMRAFAACSDQTRPTIVLHGHELAIGPAGTDPHGEWGIHVQPPVDGRAQELRGQLELAARRLAGSKGNPPRLLDEVSRFDDKATHLWAPGTPPDPPPASRGARPGYYEPAQVAPPIPSPVIPSAAPRQTPLSPGMTRPMLEVARHNARQAVMAAGRATVIMPGGPAAAAAAAAAQARPGRRTDRHASAGGGARAHVGVRTRPGFLPPDAPTRPASPGAPAGASPPAPQSFASLVNRTMPIGLELTDGEREVLNALGRAPCLGARDIARITGAADPLAWMDALLDKLARLGLDLVAPGEARDGEPTYVLRR
ncbi:MAG TPA: hypothetical protein VKZ63_14435 [Kofleriaceae bacterium]|nr:hypothetical protein [Kofleriaceae bacterium]